MRRFALVSLAVVVASTGTASGGLRPIGERFRELTAPVVSNAPLSGTGTHQPSGRTRVIVALSQPPLAEVAPRSAYSKVGTRRKLNIASSFSEAYLARLETTQDRAISALRTAIPQAKVSRRYQVLLDGFAVSLPYSQLPRLLASGIGKKVYPSLRYTMSLDRGPSVIGAPQFSTLTGATGEGVKVAVVDDGVDSEHPFLDPTGFSYPPGFPKGPAGGTTPKVIVARGFAGTGASGAVLDREKSFHGTFVAGVIAGKANTDVKAGVPGICQQSSGGCHPAVSGLSGVAPRAYIGNYRVFNTPLPLGGCCSGTTPEIVAAFEAAVRDGMDVINFSGGGPQSDPRTDALIPAVANVVRAGVVPVISAGNDRDYFGLGTAGSPATAPDAISVGATANSHIFTPSFVVTSPAVSIGRVPFVPTDNVPPGWTTSNQRLVDVGTIRGTNGQSVSRLLCDPTLPSGSLRGAIALVSRGGCSYAAKETIAGNAGAIGMVVAENRAGDPTFALFSRLSGGTISDLDGARLRSAMAGAGGAVQVRFTRDVLEVPTSWAGVPTSFSAGGLTPFGHALKPDVAAPGAEIISSTLPEFAGDQYAVMAGTSFSAPHVAGAAALLLQRHPDWNARQMKSALMSTAGAAFADSTLTQESSVLVEGAGLVNVGAADRPLVFTDPQSLSFGYLDVNSGAASRTIPVTVSDAGNGAGTWSIEIRPQVASSGATIEAAPFTLTPGGTAIVQIVARAAGGSPQGDNFGFVVLRRGSDIRRIPYAFSVTRPQLSGSNVIPLKKTQTGSTLSGDDRARVYRWPTLPFGILSIFGVDPSVNEDGKETVYSLDLPKQVVNAGVVVVRPADLGRRSDQGPAQLQRSDPSVVPRLSRRERRARVRRDSGERERLDARLPVQRRLGRWCVPPRGPVLRLGGLWPGSVHGPPAGRRVRAPLVGQRRPAAEHCADLARDLERTTDDCRTRAGLGFGRRSAVSPPHRKELPGGGHELRSCDRRRRVLVPDERSPAGTDRRGVHAGVRVRLPGDEEHQHRGQEPDAQLALPRFPARGREPSGRQLDHARGRRLLGGKDEAAGDRQLVVSDLLGRILRRLQADRARPQEPVRDLQLELAPARQEGRARAEGDRVGHLRARVVGGPPGPAVSMNDDTEWVNTKPPTLAP